MTRRTPLDRLHDIVTRSIPSGVERWRVEDAAAWHARRAADVTASVAGALLGAHDYVTPYSLWCAKAGLIDGTAEDSPAMRRGRLLEDDALQVIAEEHPDWRVAPCGFYYRNAAWRIGATPDAVAIDPLQPGFGVIQVKSVRPSIFLSRWKEDDGESELIEPPLWIAVQAIIEATLTGASWCAVAPIVVDDGIDVPVLPVPLHAPLMERLRAETAAFWASIDAGQAPDPDYLADGATIAARHPEDNGQEVDLSAVRDLPGLADELDQIRARQRVDEARADAIRARFRHAIGENEAALIGGGRRVTLRTIDKPGHWVEPTRYRQLRFGTILGLDDAEWEHALTGQSGNLSTGMQSMERFAPSAPTVSISQQPTTFRQMRFGRPD